MWHYLPIGKRPLIISPSFALANNEKRLNNP